MTGASDLMVLARVTGSLVVVLLVAVLAARLARRAGRGRGRTASLQVRDRVGLTRETCAVVLEVGDRMLLLGVSPQQVSVLAELGPSGTVVATAVRPGPTALAIQGALGALGGQAGPGVPAAGGGVPRVPAPRQPAVRVVQAPAEVPLTRREVRAATGRRRQAVPPTQRGTGSALDPRTWQQGLEALRDLTARRG